MENLTVTKELMEACKDTPEGLPWQACHYNTAGRHDLGGPIQLVSERDLGLVLAALVQRSVLVRYWYFRGFGPQANYADRATAAC
jgi:hypothetical protein